MPKTVPVWILTIDDRSGAHSSAHASREEAVHDAATFAMNRWEERANKNDALDPNRMTNDQIVEAYFTDHVEDFYAITESSITIPEPGDDADRDEKIREMARDQHHRDGEVEIDNNALVSEGDDNGAYVAAWVWVDFTDTDLDKEKEEEEVEVDTPDTPEPVDDQALTVSVVHCPENCQRGRIIARFGTIRAAEMYIADVLMKTDEKGVIAGDYSIDHPDGHEDPIDTSDIPEVGPEFFENAKLTLPEGKP